MSDDRDIGDGAAGARALLARAAAMAAHADRRLALSIRDMLIPDDARLTERERVVLWATFSAMVALIEADLRRRTARELGAGEPAETITGGAPTLDRLIAAGVPGDDSLMRELIGRTRQELLADDLVAAASAEPGSAGLLSRLAASADGAVARAALALMTAEARRRNLLDGRAMIATELSAELHHRLVWLVAAAIREQVPEPAIDRALTAAALRNLSEHDEGDGVEAAAVRLATAIDAQPDEVAALLTHAIGERHVALFAALMGRALGCDFAAARDLVVERDAGLWLALRAVNLDRAAIARIGLVLAPDADGFAGSIEAVMAIDARVARDALARLSLHPELRAALAAIGAAQ